MSDVQAISPKALHEKSKNCSINLIDVRTPIEFQEVHAKVARNIPLDALNAQDVMTSCSVSEESPLYVICQSGGRGSQAAKRLSDAGCQHVYNVAGGTLAWEAAGLPVDRGKKVISLERQVRIVAGGIVAVTSVLALVHSPFWAGISAFVGSGLVFAGVTDTCGMGLLLAKMPWNQVSNAKSTCST